MRHRLEIFTALLFVTPLMAQSPLEDYLSLAEQHNPSILKARAGWEGALNVPQQAGAFPDPTFEVGVQRDSEEENELHHIHYGVEQEFPWFGKRGTDAKTAELTADAIGFSYLEVRRKQLAAVTKAYWNLWLKRKEKVTIQHTLELARQIDNISAARLEAGSGSQADVLRTELMVLSLENRLENMARDISVAQADLNQLLNEDPLTARNTEELPALPKLERSMDSFLEEARAYCCQVMAELRRVEAAEAHVEMIRLEDRPVLGAKLEAVQYQDSGDFEEITAALMVKLPLWRSKYKGMQKEAEALLEAARASYDEELNMTLNNIKTYYTRAVNARQTMELYQEELVPKAEELVRSMREAYRAGEALAIEVLSAERSYQEALLMQYSQRAAYASAYADLMSAGSPWSPTEKETGLPPHD